VPDEPVKIFVTEPVAPIRSPDYNKETASVYRPPSQVPRFIYRAMATPPTGPGDNSSIEGKTEVKIESRSSTPTPSYEPPTPPTYVPTPPTYTPSTPYTPSMPAYTPAIPTYAQSPFFTPILYYY